MPARTRRDPHIAWPLKVVAAVAVAGAFYAGYQQATAPDEPVADPADDRAPGVERVSSERVGPADPDWTFDAEGIPSSYRITYRVQITASETTEVVSVVPPFDSRTVTYRGRTTSGPPFQERETTFGILATRTGDQRSVLEVPPALAGPRPAAALLTAEEAGLADRREVREVDGRRCQVWRTGGALAATIFVPPTAGDHFDLCVDREGLLLEELQVDGGVVTRQRVAVDVVTGGVTPESLTQIPRDVTLDVNKGGGRLTAAEPTAQPAGPFLEVAEPPAGFSHRGRFRVVPPQAALLEDGDRGKSLAAVTDVFVRDRDAIVVERGGVLDLTDPWKVEETFPDVDLGPAIGTGELLPGRGGGEVRALLGQGRYLRVSGSVDLDMLTSVARALVPVQDGTGVGFGG